MIKHPIDIEILRRLISYDPETGDLKWLERPIEFCPSYGEWRRWNSRFSGKLALTPCDTKGYRRGRILGKSYAAQRVCWALSKGEWPKFEIDHIDRCKTNNRLSNLRDVSASVNCKNQNIRRNNTSGTTGVVFHKRTSKWHAGIQDRGKKKFLGGFDRLEDAIAARRLAEKNASAYTKVVA